MLDISVALAGSKKAGNSLQQCIARYYGSLTTFNILFKNKDDQFRTGVSASAAASLNLHWPPF